MIAERVRGYADAGITTLQAKLSGDLTERLDTLGQLLDVVEPATAEPPDLKSSGARRGWPGLACSAPPSTVRPLRYVHPRSRL